MANQTGTILLVLGGILTFIFVLGSILLAASFGIVLPTEVAIVFDTTTRIIDSTKVFSSGRYLIGLGKSFITFPITYQLLDFSVDPEEGGDTLTVNTPGGQTVFIDVSFYYRIDESKVQEIYRIARTTLKSFIIREATDSIKTSAALFTVNEYILFRRQIAQKIHEDLNSRLYTKYYCWVPLLQLRAVDLPDSVENSKIQLAVATQNTKTSELQRNITIINQETTIKAQVYDSNKTVALQSAASEGAKIEAQAISEGNRLVVETVALAQLNLTSSLGFNATHLITYNFIKMLRASSSDDNYVIGFQGSVPVILG